MSDYAYDIECLPNYWSMVVVRIECGTRWIFEVTTAFVNQSVEIATFVNTLGAIGARMVGFNNVGYDYPLLHFLCRLVRDQGYATPEQLYWKSQQIIGSNDRFGNIVWESDRICAQLDLYKIHHFDNVAKATGLKALQFNMRAHSVDDMPFHHTQHITTQEERDTILRYNCHDVSETIRFYHYSKNSIQFRDDLSARLGKDFTNHNDTKIGKDYFIDRLEAASPGITRDRNGPRQTPRASIPLADVIFPYVTFNRPEFAHVLQYLKGVTIRDTKAAPELKGLSATLDGFKFDFGTGGIHGSITNAHVAADDLNEIVDIDVESYYPNLAIKNRLFPKHLGELFCVIYEDLFNERRSHAKKTSPNEMLKLALNGVYGESNNKFGAFLDPAYTMAITINGQLLLCMLAEWLLTIPGIRLIQANTDGVTVVCPRAMRGELDRLCGVWQQFTMLKLEFASYSDMWIRDVNSYVARTLEGKMKRIGAYAYETARENPATREIGWHKDHSALVIPKAAEAALIANDVTAIDRFVWSHPDPWDFMLRAKAPKGSRLVLDHGETQQPLPPTTRYYVAQKGGGLVKIMPELPSKPGTGERHMRINVGRKAAQCNVATDFDPNNIDRDFYISEARKLVGMITV